MSKSKKNTIVQDRVVSKHPSYFNDKQGVPCLLIGSKTIEKQMSWVVGEKVNVIVTNNSILINRKES